MPFGWVLLVFVVVAVILEIIFGVALTLTGLNQVDSLNSLRVLYVTMPTLITALVATFITWLSFKEPTGLRDRRFAPRLLIGGFIGALALTICVVVPALFGATSLTLAGTIPIQAGVIQFIALAPAGIGEEILLRGVGFNALRRGAGDLAAVLVSSSVFGAMHFFNPHASLVATVVIALVGVWFGLLVVRTNSVWMSVGTHLAWNFFEGFVFGQPVSGNAPGTSIFIAGYGVERDFWSGGDFGPEAAGFTVLVLVAAIVATWFWKPALRVTSAPTSAASPTSSPS